MNDIPSDIYCIISSHLELINILHLCQCNTYLLSTLKNDLQNKIKMKRRWVEKHIVPMLHKIMNGIHILVFAPFIKYKPCFSGLTGYLDTNTVMPNVGTRQVPDFNQMYGGPATPMVGAASPGGQPNGPPPVQMAAPEPMAANGVLGGGFRGSSW